MRRSRAHRRWLVLGGALVDVRIAAWLHDPDCSEVVCFDTRASLCNSCQERSALTWQHLVFEWGGILGSADCRHVQFALCASWGSTWQARKSTWCPKLITCNLRFNFVPTAGRQHAHRPAEEAVDIGQGVEEALQRGHCRSRHCLHGQCAVGACRSSEAAAHAFEDTEQATGCRTAAWSFIHLQRLPQL